MSKISAINFTNNVEYNRQRLIQHCRDNELTLNDNETLDNVVALNNQINLPKREDTFVVEFKDLDGNDFVPPQYVNKGESAVIPEGYPELDSEYLDFVEWAVNGADDLTNVQRDIVCLPQYQTKYDEETGQRPTYLVCYFEEGYLSPTIRLAGTNAYIDWGDGSDAVNLSTSKTHTYANAGLYTIKIYGDSYYVSIPYQGTPYGIFDSSAYKYSLLKAYFGDKITSNPTVGGASSLKYAILPDNKFSSLSIDAYRDCYSLVSVVVPKGITTMVSNSSKSQFGNCRNLKYIILPEELTMLSDGCFSACYNLKKISLPDTVKKLNQQAFSNCYYLEEVNNIENVEDIGSSCFSACYSLKHIKLNNNLKTLNSSTFNNCVNLSSIYISNNVTNISTPFGYTKIKEITIPPTVTTIATGVFNNCFYLNNVVLYNDFDISGLEFLQCNLYDASLIDIVNKLKDNSNSTAKTIKFSKQYYLSRLNTICLNEFGEVVPYGTEGAISLLQKLVNKNWTVTLSN